jgi:hypothetical protein
MVLLDKQTANYKLQDDAWKATLKMYFENKSQDEIFDYIIELLSKEENVDKNFEYHRFSVQFMVDNYYPLFSSPHINFLEGQHKRLKPHDSQRFNIQYLKSTHQKVFTTLWPVKWCLNLLINMASGQSDGLLKVLVDSSESDENGFGSGIFDTNSKMLILWMWLNGNTEPFKIDKSLKKYLKDELKPSLNTACKDDVHKIIDTIIETDSDYFDIDFFERNGLGEVVEVIRNFRVSVWFRNFSSSSNVMSLYRTLASIGILQSPLHLMQSRFQTEFMRDVFKDSSIDYYSDLVEPSDGMLTPVFCDSTLNKKDFFKKQSEAIHKSNGYVAYDFYYHVLLPLYFVKSDDKNNIYFDYESYHDLSKDKFKYHLLYKPDGDRTLNYVDDLFDKLKILKETDLERYNEFTQEWFQLIYDLNKVWRFLNKFGSKFTTLGNGASGELAKYLKDNFSQFEPTQISNIQKIYHLGHDAGTPMKVILLNVFRYIKNKPKVKFNKHEDLIFEYYLSHYKTQFVEFLTQPKYSSEYLDGRYIKAWRELSDENKTKALPSIIEILYDIRGGGNESVGTDYVCYFHEQLFKNLISDKISNEERIKNIATNDTARGVAIRKLEEGNIPFKNGETLWQTKHGPLKVTVPQTDPAYGMVGHLELGSKGGDVLHDKNIDKLYFFFEPRITNCVFEIMDDKDYVLIWKNTMAIQNKGVHDSFNEFTSKYLHKFSQFTTDFQDVFKYPSECTDEAEKLYFTYKHWELWRENLKYFVNNSLIGLEYDSTIMNPEEFDYIVKEEKEQELEVA